MNNRKRWYFTDKWYGNVRYFDTLKAAKEAVSKQIGETVPIRDTKSGKIIFAPASGYTPP